ncbi:MAG: phosphoglucosamine mutase [Candidatus Bipolaricaulota bacterium]|nr:phosphoglucosamine mutase [Candidatus Bipolaricaulota bacterium]
MDLFGTDGIRGEVNEDITPELALKLGKSTSVITEKGDSVLVCTDTRQSGRSLQYALASGISSVGRNAYIMNVLPTPGIPLLMDRLDAQLGAVVSASHNLAQDNGIKFFGSDGLKLTPNVEQKLEKFIITGDGERWVNWEEIGNIFAIEDSEDLYLESLKERLGSELPDLTGLELNLDCAHGATYHVAPRIISELGAELNAIGVDPSGFNINQNCGSTSLDRLKKKVVSQGSDLGIAFDGDGDRALFVDEEGNEVDGDRVLYFAAQYLKEQGELEPPVVVSTIMSNLGLEKSLSRIGIDLVRTQVGDKYVAQEMLKRDAIIGGEQSGHVIFRDVNTTGDGIVTALMVLKVLKATGKKLSDLGSGMLRYPQVLENVPTDNKEDFQADDKIQTEIDKWEEVLGEEGRILVRPSGTQDVIRVMVEGKNQDHAEKVAGKLGDYIDSVLNG